MLLWKLKRAFGVLYRKTIGDGCGVGGGGCGANILSRPFGLCSKTRFIHSFLSSYFINADLISITEHNSIHAHFQYFSATFDNFIISSFIQIWTLYEFFCDLMTSYKAAHFIYFSYIIHDI